MPGVPTGKMPVLRDSARLRAGILEERKQSVYNSAMSDPRNVAHDKKVQQEKEKETPDEKETAAAPPVSAAAPAAADAAEEGPTDHEQSVTVLSKLKEMEFHSRANIETLAQLLLTVEDELKQKEFGDSLGAVYSAQDGFQTKITELIASYQDHVDGMKPAV